MIEYIILMPLVILIFFLTFVVARDTFLNKNQKRIMLGIVGLIAVLLIQNVVDYVMQSAVSLPYLRTLESIVGYSVRPIIIVMFCKLVRPSGRFTLAWILVAYNAAIYLTATFSHFAFYINEDNKFQGGVFFFSKTVFVVGFILLFHLIYCTVREYRNKKTWIWIPIANIVIIMIASLMDISTIFYRDYPVSYLNIAIVCCSLFYYIWLHLEFAKAHERALMAEQRIKIMMSQIQPHFVSNTLTTIQSLCLLDPQKAFEVTGKFGSYLRNNIASLEEESLIPIKKELEHTRVYTEIEMLRFPEISVEYHNESEDFSVPALTIQPLVENSIRHGVRDRDHGIVEILTQSKDDINIITIRDNGVGFDTEKPLPTDETHLGIQNVRDRLREMCGGKLTIESRENEGTTVTITIPREKE